MELKYVSEDNNNEGCACSNRTFMELKCATVTYEIQSKLGSNRTFMELKCGKRDA